MHFNLKPVVRMMIAGVLVAVNVPLNTLAQTPEYLVSPADLQKAAVDASRTREQNRADLNSFFASDKAQTALKSAHIDPQQVTTAIATLSDSELAQVTARTHQAQADFAAGNMNDHDLLIILVCIAALVLIIVAVR